MLLRAARLRVKLSTRAVERMSRRIALEKESQDFYISHAWLTDAEKGIFTPGVFKFYSLSVIYKKGFDEILGFFGLHLKDIVREQMWLTLPHTYLIGSQPESSIVLPIPAEAREKIDFGKTNLISRMFGQWGGMPVSLFDAQEISSKSVYGYVGTEDFTLFPLIRPGSFVQIDSSQTKVVRGGWQNEFDRPIYFVELRDSYACSWCESREGSLLLIPCHQSPRAKVREVRFPGDSEIVGRVTAVSMRIAG